MQKIVLNDWIISLTPLNTSEKVCQNKSPGKNYIPNLPYGIGWRPNPYDNEENSYEELLFPKKMCLF